jgi:hypothetical protein
MPVALLGLLGALVAAPLPQLSSLVLVGVIVATSGAWAYGVRPVDRVIAVGLVAAGAAAVLVGLGSLLGGGVVLPLLVIAVLSPPVVGLALRHLTRAGVAGQSRAGLVVAADDTPTRSGPGGAGRFRLGGPGGSTTPAPPADQPALPIDTWMTQPATTMDDTALCLAWRRTSTVLGRAPSSSVVEALARRRQELLDEMERRNGEGFRAWLASGARASGDPSRYIVASDMPRPRPPSE